MLERLEAAEGSSKNLPCWGMKSHNKEKKTEEGKKKENQDKTTQVANKKTNKINIKLRIWLCTNNYKK